MPGMAGNALDETAGAMVTCGWVTVADVGWLLAGVTTLKAGWRLCAELSLPSCTGCTGSEAPSKANCGFATTLSVTLSWTGLMELSSRTLSADVKSKNEGTGAAAEARGLLVLAGRTRSCGSAEVRCSLGEAWAGRTPRLPTRGRVRGCRLVVYDDGGIL